MKYEETKNSERKGFLLRVACWFNGHRDEKHVESELAIHEKGNRNIVAFSGRIYVCACGRERYDGSTVPVYEGHWTGFLEWKRSKWTMTKRKLKLDEGPLLPMEMHNE